MKLDVKTSVEEIIESLTMIESYTRYVTQSGFKQGFLLQDAVIHRLEIIGDAAKNIPEDFRNAHPEIPWKEIAGLRDILIHAYFQVNIDRVWNVMKHELPDIKRKLLKVVQKLE